MARYGSGTSSARTFGRLGPPAHPPERDRPPSHGPRPEDQEDDPATLPTQERERRARRRLRGRDAEPDDEPQQRDVDRTEDGREPRRQAIPRIAPGERPY